MCEPADSGVSGCRAPLPSKLEHQTFGKDNYGGFALEATGKDGNRDRKTCGNVVFT